MTNLEYFKENIKEYVKETGELACAVVKLKDFSLEGCSYKECSKCKENVVDWLLEEYKESIELKKWEYDLLLILVPSVYLFNDLQILNDMKSKGYFKGIKKTSIELIHVLNNCEIVD